MGNAPAATLPGAIAGGRYQVRRLLGEGVRKRVYLAYDTRLDREVALALIKSEGLDAVSLARVRREAQAMGRLGDHPHIVTIHDVGEEDGRAYIVSQFMAGGSVEDLLKGSRVQGAKGSREETGSATASGTLEPSNPRTLPVEQVLRLGDHVCRALEHAHALGVIHRDLKPANVWLTADGTAKLGDFGLALDRDRSRMTVEGMMVGTVAYMAPEQALGKSVDARSDLYALGALLYEMVTGRPPFVGDEAVAVITQHLHTAPIAPSWHNATIPRPLEQLILELLEKDPAKRPPHAAAVREALVSVGTAREGSGSRAQRPDPTPDTQPPTPVSNPLDRLDAGVFVGRDKEMTTLRAAVEDALAGRGRMALIAGEPGIGKTRTAQELATYAQLRGMQVLWGRCHEGGGAPAYWPWVQAIRAYVHERSPQELLAEMGSGAPDIANVISAVRERLPDLPPPPRLEPEQERFRLFDSVTTFLKRAATRQALMLVVDDLHWADAPSLLLLQFLAREIDTARLAIVAIYRDEEAQPGRPLFGALAELARAAVNQRIALGGLQEPDIAQLIERAAGEKPSPALVTTMARQTEGNPFFVGEVVRWLVAEGRLERAATDTIGVPPSVREVIGRRLQRLSPACNQLLTTAAVVGRSFALELLALVSDEPEDVLLDRVEEAVAARVLAEVRDEAGAYSFMHALIRETLYGELSRGRRQRLHQRIGEALESLYAARLDHHLPALAYHFGEAAADTMHKAIAYAQRAGDRAMVLTAYEDAATYYQRVLDALDRSAGPDERRRAELLLALGRAQFGCGKPLAEARATYLQAAAVARHVGAPELLARAALAYSTGPRLPGLTDDTRAQLLEEANTALVADDTLLHALVLSRLAVDLVDRSGSAERVAALCDEAVAIARGHEESGELGYVLLNVAAAHWQPESLPVRSRLKELVLLAEQVGDKRLALSVHLLCITTSIRLGDIAAVDREIEAYIRLAEGLRLPYFLHVVGQLRSMRATMEGRFTDAEGFALTAFGVGGRVQHEFAQQVFWGLMFGVRREQGRLGDLEDVLTSTAERLPDTAIWRVALALLYSDQGRTETVRREFERLAAQGFSTVRVEQYYWLSTIAVLAEICAFLDDSHHAHLLYDFLQPSGDLCVVEGDAVICFGAVARHLGLLAATMRRWDDANRHFESALAMNTGLRAPPLIARTQCNYASMLLERDAPGDCTKARELLTAAIDTAQQLGMKVLLENALTLKLKSQGLGGSDTKTSIDTVASEVAEERPDLRPQAAPDGTVTLFFSDMEGFTSMTERLGDQRAHAVLEAHNRIIRQQLARHGGFEVKSQGDGFMVAFQSARRAIMCAIAVQRAFAGYAAEHPEEPVRVRIGLHTGEAIKEGEDFFGTTVNLAARIAAQARGGEILVSAVLKELTESGGDLRFGAARSVQLKGVTGARTVFSVPWAGEVEAVEINASLPPGSAVLRQENAFWTLSYEATTSRLKDMKGLHYLAHLLRYPGQEFHALDLVRGTDSRAQGTGNPGPGTRDTGLEVLDATAKAAYKRRLTELRDELEEAEEFNDTGRAERARVEIEAIGEQLSAAVGLSGRDRATGSSAERARSTVTKRIKESLKKIGEVNAPLADHLGMRVKTGTFCVYVPDAAHPVAWEL